MAKLKLNKLNRKTSDHLSNQRGQVAIFIALIFQVLFLFFAMVVNVGLLVHHKINLQNSVDLAAYYGASKQAEMMNAIGHVNYQIRQSWKLLTWRYRQLGTAGAFTAAHPFDKPTKTMQGPQDEGVLQGNAYQPFYDAPSFCITYQPFQQMPRDENTCKTSAEQYSSIPLFTVPPVIIQISNVTRAVRDFSIAQLMNANQRCIVIGPYNYTMLSKFVSGYAIDQANRKETIMALANAISKNTSDFLDIDGESARDGMLKTFRKNLTTPNLESLVDTDFQVLNSLGLDACKYVADDEPPKWLSEIKIRPSFTYTDTRCNVSTQTGAQNSIEVMHRALDDLPYNYQNNRPSVAQDLVDLIDHYKQFSTGFPSKPYNFSLGYEKNPWCMAYVGIAAKTKPKIPFAPLGEVELVAKAYAKPFGAKIGPWYSNRWDPNAPQSVDNKQARIDMIAPPRINDPSQVGTQANDPTRFANYSKYPGDSFGLKSRLTLGEFGRAIYFMDPFVRNTPYDQVIASPGVPNPDSAGAPNYKHWDHVGNFFTDEKSGDLLAWDDKTRRANPMRQLETVAIAPDLFDVTYYSIEPDFYNVYFKRIRDNFVRRTGARFIPRGDLGSRIGDTELESFSIKNQFEELQKLFDMTSGPVDVRGKLTYLAFPNKGMANQKADPLLTSWIGKSISDYSFDSSKFANCDTRPGNTGATSGDCIGPARTGYSVKFVSGDYLRSSDIAADGKGAKGNIMNPPENF